MLQVGIIFLLLLAVRGQFIGQQDYYFDLANDYDQYSFNNLFNTKLDKSGSLTNDIVCRDEITGEQIDWYVFL
jgi:hypothetical protein